MIEKVALRLLSLKSYSHAELRKKLIRRGFAPEEIEPVLQKYQRLGFLNDGELADRRMEGYKKRGYGPQWVAAKLKMQGLKASSYPEEEQKATIRRLLQTSAFAKKEKPKQIAALQRRGFDLDLIFEIIKF